MKAAIKARLTGPAARRKSRIQSTKPSLGPDLKKRAAGLLLKLVLVNKTDNLKRLLDTKEMAKLITVSPETLTAWRKQNLVPHLKIRHVMRFDAERVLAALQKLETKVVAP
jgi:hypothetical protein